MERISRLVGRVSDGWRRRRDRVLSSPRFQRWAARFPLTRGVAKRRASALFDLCSGFVYSQVLYTCVRLGVLEALAAGPLTADALAPRIGLSREATVRLLDAATALRLTERRGEHRYGLGMHGTSYLGNPGLAKMIEHHALFYRDLSDPLALLRGEHGPTELGRFWSYTGACPEADPDVSGYSDLMGSTVTMLADDVLAAYPVERHRRVLDVGGGEGGFLAAVAARAPHLSLTLFELPAVARRAEASLARAGLSSRATVVGGDVFRDPLPRSFDLVTLVRVLHDHDDDRALAILEAARRALAPGGVLLVAEPMSETAGAEPVEAYFAFYLLAMGQGRPRSPEQLRGLLERAGFSRPRLRATRQPMLARLVVAEAARA